VLDYCPAPKIISKMKTALKMAQKKAAAKNASTSKAVAPA
jgi:hypothetical protein